MTKLDKVKLWPETKNCVVCLKPAICHSGYVIDLKTNDEIIAGWCNVHKRLPIGFSGVYKNAMKKK